METIKIIKLINGDDIVCTIPTHLLDEKSPLVKIDKPLQIKYVPQMEGLTLRDYVALIKWTSYSDDSIVSIPKDKIMTITTASSEMSKSYVTVSGSYEKAGLRIKQESYERERVSDEVNDKLNEIFDSLEDSTKH